MGLNPLSRCRWQKPKIFLLITSPLWAYQTQAAQCEFTVANEWQNGYTGNLVITNDTSEVIDSWQVALAFSQNETIGSSWDANFSGNNPYLLTNKSWNGQINAGESKSLGFNGTKSLGALVSQPTLSGVCNSSPDDNDNVEFTAEINASTLSGVAPLTVDFNAQITGANEEQVEYLWRFAEESTAVSQNAQHTFTAEGEYIVTLTVNDGTVSSSADPLTISVSEPQVKQAYVLDSTNSSLYFVSTKKEHTVETHTFNSLSGGISLDGEANLQIDLNSVDTGVDIRDGRMKEHLFAVDTYPVAQVSLSLDYDLVKAVPVGTTQGMDISATLNLYGTDVQLDTQVQVSRLSSSKLLVQNNQPILLDATDFGLEGGIETLKTLANLTSISYAVPVNFNLVFEIQEPAQAEQE